MRNMIRKSAHNLHAERMVIDPTAGWDSIPDSSTQVERDGWHWVAMWGSFGYLPDDVNIHRTQSAAVEDMASLFDLNERKQRALARNGIVSLNTADYAQYASVDRRACQTNCECGLE